MITIEATTEALHVRIPRGALSLETVEKLLRSFRLESAVAGSQLTDAAANQLAEEMKANWWTQNSGRIFPAEQK